MRNRVPLMVFWALCAFTTGLCAVASEPASKFPASISVIETKPPLSSSFTVRLTVNPGVEIYANKPQNAFYSHVNATLIIRDNRGETVKATIDYPVGTKIEDSLFGDRFIYRDSVDIVVSLEDHAVAGAHALTLKVAGFSRSSLSCLGTAKLTAHRE